MKSYLEYNGNLGGTSPRKAIKKSLKIGLIKYGEEWLELLQDRNRTAHTYDEECAMEIFNKMKNSYINLFEELIKTFEKELS